MSPNEYDALNGNWRISGGVDSLRIMSNKSGVSSPARAGTAESGVRDIGGGG